MLIDLENIVRLPAGWLPEDEAEALLQRALDLAGPAQFRLAVAPANVLRRYVTVLIALGLACEPVEAGPDAADLTLLAHAEHLAAVGYTRFTVLSGDHLFADICRRHPTTIIARRGQPVARVLRQAALAVRAA